jgi:hypothetical protein
MAESPGILILTAKLCDWPPLPAPAPSYLPQELPFPRAIQVLLGRMVRVPLRSEDGPVARCQDVSRQVLLDLNPSLLTVRKIASCTAANQVSTYEPFFTIFSHLRSSPYRGSCIIESSCCLCPIPGPVAAFHSVHITHAETQKLKILRASPFPTRKTNGREGTNTSPTGPHPGTFAQTGGRCS